MWILDRRRSSHYVKRIASSEGLTAVWMVAHWTSLPSDDDSREKETKGDDHVIYFPHTAKSASLMSLHKKC